MIIHTLLKYLKRTADVHRANIEIIQTNRNIVHISYFCYL